MKNPLHWHVFRLFLLLSFCESSSPAMFRQAYIRRRYNETSKTPPACFLIDGEWMDWYNFSLSEMSPLVYLSFQSVRLQLTAYRDQILEHLSVKSQENQEMRNGHHVNRDSMSMLTLSDSNSVEQNNHAATRLQKNARGSQGEIGSGEGDEESRSGFALVVNGHSLVFALSEELEFLFLAVAENCNGKLLP